MLPIFLATGQDRRSSAPADRLARAGVTAWRPRHQPASARRVLCVKQFEGLLIDFHVLDEGNRRGLGTGDQMHPEPGFAGRVKFLYDRLVMLEGMHFGEA